MHKPGDTIDTPDGPALVIESERDDNGEGNGFGSAILLSHLAGDRPRTRVALDTDDAPAEEQVSPFGPSPFGTP